MKGARLKDNRGATMVVVGILMIVLVGFAALALDIANLAMVRNELQNAADAGALRGAHELYDAAVTAVNEGANQEAFIAVTSNTAASVAGQVPAESHGAESNDGDIQRGHWDWINRTFTPNDSLTVPQLAGMSGADLAADTSFVNAVRVTARRQQTPVYPIFARIFGFDSFEAEATAVAYVGFAGKLGPGEADQPIVICESSIQAPNGDYTCNIGRMINSGNDPNQGGDPGSGGDETDNNTGGWTSFDQSDGACSGGTNASEMKSLVCSGGNPQAIYPHKNVATTGGELQSVFSELYKCWEEQTQKIRSLNWTLPVVTCPSNNVGTCEEVVGAVTVNVVWIVEKNDPDYLDVPTRMDEWYSDNPDGRQRWNEFAAHFNLLNSDGTLAPYQSKAIYFKPDCTPNELKGDTGGEFFGVLARPKLVQ